MSYARHCRLMRQVSKSRPALGPEARKRLGETLRASFGETLSKSLPRRHRDLLQQFEHSDGDKKWTAVPRRWDEEQS
jgi:hypothetical protein